MNLVDAVRKANLPKKPEDSLRARVACAGAVLVSIAACAAQHEVSAPLAVLGAALVSAGMTFSYLTRVEPPWWIKLLVAATAVAALVWFVEALSSRSLTGITTVEDPLTVLLIWIQVVHSFHVPAGRDLVFALGASAGLMAVAGAQAIDLSYGLYVVPWVGFGLWTLVELWRSASAGGSVPVTGLIAALTALAVAAAGAFLILPAPTVAIRTGFQSSPGAAGSVGVPGALAGDGTSATQLSKPGSPAGRTRVGGYLGFANTLDTALRGSLGDSVVMYVRAQRPSYWIGETFDTWDGQSWDLTGQTDDVFSGGSPFVLPTPEGDPPGGQSDLQTFYVADSTPDLVFHAESAHEVWFPTPTVFYGNDGTVVSPIGLGRGAIYTVESDVLTPSAAQLEGAGAGSLPPRQQRQYTELPKSYARVAALTRSITAGATTTYGRVEALIAWMGAHTHYSTDIPPLPPGADTVDEFLFGDRTGFCEQISTSLAVMLRTLGIPVREAVGYVPGPYDPVTDLYEVQAKDAHAWVQVWFPGYGWQSFDPTAVVPPANPSPGTTALRDLGRALRRVPPVPVGSALAVAIVAVVLVRRRRTRPATWAEALSRRIDAAGRRAGRRRRPGETLGEYAGALDALSPGEPPHWSPLAAAAEASAYGGVEPSPEARRDLLAAAGRR